MFDDLAAYFHENVITSYAAYVDVRENQSYGRSKDLRAAIVAATALYHLREHIPKAHKKSRSAIAKECPDYNVLGDVVNAAKHRDLNRGRPQLNSAEDVYEMTVVTQFEDEGDSYSDARKVVMVKLKDGSERDLLDALTNVMNYWGKEFTRIGVVKDFKPFPMCPHPGEQFIPRDEAKNLDTEIIRGVRFKQVLKLLKFDPTLGKSEPIDLSGSELRYRIYKPSYSVDVQLKHPISGKEYAFTLKLGDDQSLEWHSLKTDDERQSFMSRLAQERRDELQSMLLKELEAEQINRDDPSNHETDT